MPPLTRDETRCLARSPLAQGTEVHLIDDLDGKEIPAGKGETVLFALDGTSYEIDLLAKNAAALRKTLATYVAAARPAKPPRGARRRRATEPAESRPGFATLTTYGCSDRGPGGRPVPSGQPVKIDHPLGAGSPANPCPGRSGKAFGRW
jgi:hypothetical protein